MKKTLLIAFLPLWLLAMGCARAKPRTEVPPIMEAAWWSGLDEVEMERPDEFHLRAALAQGHDRSSLIRRSVIWDWLAAMQGPTSNDTPLPVAIAVVTEDQRPVYHEYGLAFAFLPLVPYSQSSFGGLDPLYPEQIPSPPIRQLNYRDLIPLFVAHSLRKSGVVCCANCEQSRECLNQYEIVLTLTLREACTSWGFFFYGLSLPGDLLWLTGLPAGRAAAGFEVDWRLSVVSTGEVLGRGEYRYRKTAYAGFYYGWGGARVLSDHYPKKSRHLFYYPKGDKALLPGVTEEIVSDVVKALRHKPQRYWETLAQEHEKWRLGRGEKLTHKRR